MDKALLDTDIFSEIVKEIDQRVVVKAVAYRTAFGRYTIAYTACGRECPW